MADEIATTAPEERLLAAAIEWNRRRHEHTNDANCRAGSHDSCPYFAAESELFVAAELYADAVYLRERKGIAEPDLVEPKMMVPPINGDRLNEIFALHGAPGRQVAPSEITAMAYELVKRREQARRAAWRAHLAQKLAQREMDRIAAERAPIPMRLPCPECGELHIDDGEFATKPHHTHACQHCGMVWRPAIVATIGVQFLPGFRDPTIGEVLGDRYRVVPARERDR